MARADHGISLMKRPPVLKHTEARKTNSADRIRIFFVICNSHLNPVIRETFPDRPVKDITNRTGRP